MNLVLSVAPDTDKRKRLLELTADGVRFEASLRREQVKLLQRFFEQAPDYFVSVNGEPATPTEARDELQGALPAGWSCSRLYWLGISMVAVLLTKALPAGLKAAESH